MSKFRSFCRFWFNFCRFFERFCSKFRNPLNNKKRAMHFFLEANITVFCFPNTSEWLHRNKKISTLFLCNLCTFWIVLVSECQQTFNKDWTHIPLGFQGNICRFRSENGWKVTVKSRKLENFCRFLTFSVNCYLRLENFGKLKGSKRSRW